MSWPRHHRSGSDPRRDEAHAVLEPRPEVGRALNAFGKGLEGKDAAIAAGTQFLDLRQISQNVRFVDQHAMGIAQARERERAVRHARDMRKPGALRKKRPFAREMM